MFSFIKKYQRYLLAATLALPAVLIMCLDLNKGNDLPFLEKIVCEVTSPVQKAITFSARGIKGVWSNYIILTNIKSENSALRKTIKTLRQENFELKETLSTNTRLRALLGFKKNFQVPMMPAEVIAYDPSTWFKTILIDKGRQDGIARNMAVVASEGVVGRVLKVSRTTSKLLLMTDQRSAIDAIVQRSRAKAILVGKIDAKCQLKYVFRADDIRVGDGIVSSGLGGMFPKGLPLGRVTKVRENSYGMFQEVEVAPAVALNKLEEVFIVVGSHRFIAK